MSRLSIKTSRPTVDLLRLCVCILAAVILTLGGLLVSATPAQATGINPAGPVTYNLTVCVPWQQQFKIVPSCPPGTVFYWLVGGSIPGFVNLDQNSGMLTACPDLASAGTSVSFQVWCTELSIIPPCLGIASASVTLNFLAVPPPCVTLINPVFYPVAWEGLPYTMTLSATGGIGPLSWSAAGLPLGLATDNATGIISGVPAPGTCGIYTVTVTVTDLGTCSNCCPPVSRPFILLVDCWANYPSIFYFTTACDFKVSIGPGLTYGQTNVTIDGDAQSPLAGNASETYTSVPCESHVVMVDRIVSGPDANTRYSVIGPYYKSVTNTDNIAYFDYQQEVLINTSSDPVGVANPSGGGFYAVGSSFNSSAPSPVMSSDSGTRYIFKSWRLPDGSTNPNRDLVYTVTRTGMATAVYDTYYLLQLKSDYPPVDESSWELKDSNAKYNLALQPVPLPNFWGLIGAVNRPFNSSGSHVMTGPYTQTISWGQDYTVPIIIGIVILLIIIGLVLGVTLGLRRKTPPAAAAVATTVVQPTQPGPPPAAVTTPAETEVTKAAETNFCPKCGAPVDKDAIFCRKCGARLMDGK